MTSTSTTPRRFKPELVEESTTTSSKKHRRFTPEHVSSESRTSRKSPAASSNASTTDKEGGEAEESISTAHKISAADPPSKPPKPRRKFVPEPIETLSSTNRKKQPFLGATEADAEDEDAAPLLPHEKMGKVDTKPKKQAPRKFSPVVLETAKRSRKSGDTGPTVLLSDKTNISPGDETIARPRLKPLPGPVSNPSSSEEVPTLKPPVPTRQQSVKPHHNTRTNTKERSFKVPSLPSIDSSESEESDSASQAQSGKGESDTSDEANKDDAMKRESEDENVSGYLLALAARAAEKQLREAEAAAYANADYHEPVAHYVNRSDSEEEGRRPPLPDLQGRDSEDEELVLKEMRKHGEHVFKQKQQRKRSIAFEVEYGSQSSKHDAWDGKRAPPPFSRPETKPKNLIGGAQKDKSLHHMRKAACPPMLGGSIDFPRCPSPDFARFDVTQGADFLKRNMDYLGQGEKGGLWADQNRPKQGGTATGGAGQGAGGMWGSKKPDAARKEAEEEMKNGNQDGKAGKGGLWGGLCAGGPETHKAPAILGLVTPVATPLGSPLGDKDNPMLSLITSEGDGSCASPQEQQRLTQNDPLSPPRSPSEIIQPDDPETLAAIDLRLELEAKVDVEFSDAFVTQVYNYLSIGYPSLARKFDDELSRISKVPIEDLRNDDKLAEARGHVRLGDHEVDGGDEGISEKDCRRWRALRTYVREWGRQMLIREQDPGGPVWGMDPHRAWGIQGRRGSWGN